MPELISSKTVRARKAHQCRCCGGVAIQPGDTYDRAVFVYDGLIYTWVTCRACSEITDEVFTWAGSPYDEGIGADTYCEWARDMEGDEKWGGAARAYLIRAGLTPTTTTEGATS